MKHRNPGAAWSALAFDTWALGLEASAVVAMRMTKIASGGSDAMSEASLMATEKMSAAMELGAALALGGGTTPLAGGQRAVRLYRRKVAANRRRLARESSK